MGTNRSPQPINRQPDAHRKLESWKEIAAFLGSSERTVRRWEAERSLPVHRVPGGERGRVFAYTRELSNWLAGSPDRPSPEETPARSAAPPPIPVPERPIYSRRWWFAVLLMGPGAVAATLLLVHSHSATSAHHAPKAGAEELYLQGRFFWSKRTPESLRKAVDDFAQAIVRDPNYAPAYVGLADCYNLLREFSAMPDSAAYPRALDAARKAVQLDDSSAEAHNSLAFVSFYWNWNAKLADREFRRAIELNPGYVLAHHWRANFLMCLGRYQEALDEIERARKLDPNSQAIVADKGLLLSNLHRLEEAIALLKQVEERDPDFSASHRYLSWVHLKTKDYPAYLAEGKLAAQLAGDDRLMAAMKAAEQGFTAGGGRGLLESTLRFRQQLYATGKGSAYDVAQAYAWLGRQQEALHYLQISLAKMEPDIVGLRVDDCFQGVSKEPEYVALLRQFDRGAHR